MDRKQQGTSLIIVIVSLVILLLVGGLSYYFYGKSKQPVVGTEKPSPVVEEQPKKMTEEEAKALLRATEVISIDLPSSVRFWTEAYCPGSGTPYDYSVPEGYSILSCDTLKQEKGTHGGCPTCIMSEIELKSITSQAQANSKSKYWEGTKYYFEYLDSLVAPGFLAGVKDNPDIKLGLSYYEQDMFFGSRLIQVDQGCQDERGFCSKGFIMKDKDYQESEYYNYENDYSIFSPRSSHMFGGSALSLANRNMTAEYVGLKISDIGLVRDMEIEFVIDARGGYYEEPDENNRGFINDLLGIDTAEACGPAQIVYEIGASDLVLQRIENGIYWFKLKRPIDLRMPGNICREGQSNCDICDKCQESCENYSVDDQQHYICEAECDYGVCITWPDDSLMFNIRYLPTGKSGPLQVQLADIVFKDNDTKVYYVPKLGNKRLYGEYSAVYYKAYLVDSHCFVDEKETIPADCY